MNFPHRGIFLTLAITAILLLVIFRPVVEIEPITSPHGISSTRSHEALQKLKQAAAEDGTEEHDLGASEEEKEEEEEAEFEDYDAKLASILNFRSSTGEVFWSPQFHQATGIEETEMAGINNAFAVYVADLTAQLKSQVSCSYEENTGHTIVTVAPLSILERASSIDL